MLVSGWKIRANCKLNAISKWLQKQNITFCLFEQQITAYLIYSNQILRDKKWLVAKGLGAGKMGSYFLMNTVSVWGDEVLEIVVIVTQHLNVTNATELYT